MDRVCINGDGSEVLKDFVLIPGAFRWYSKQS